MNLSGVNESIKTLAELINNLASVALKLILIGAVLLFEQWIEHY